MAVLRARGAAAAEPQVAPPSSSSAGSVWSGDVRISGLLWGTQWVGPTISYSDTTSGSDYGAGYAADDDRDGIPASLDGFSPLSDRQTKAVHAVLNADVQGRPAAHAGFSAEGLTALDIVYAGRGDGSAVLRFANSRDAAGPQNTAYTFYPDWRDTGGDAWFDESGVDPVAGNYDYLTVIHETGHALGLRHGHDGPNALAREWDSLEFTVMTYRSFIGAVPNYYRNGPIDYPQTWMMLDIAALQHLYGADFTTNAGDTTYAWSPTTGATIVDGAVAIAPAGNRVFMTVWDGGGTDTYDLSAYAVDLAIDLRPGESSRLASAQLADLGGGPNGGRARGNVFNALQHEGDRRSLIENAKGGGGDDTLRGNDAGNRLEGGGGADRLIGDGGKDTLLGGAGSDWLTGGSGADTLTGGGGKDRFVFTSKGDSPKESACDVILDFERPGRAKGDLIDLAAVDARDDRSGDQAFDFGGRGRGHLQLVEKDGATLVCADTGGCTAWDFVLRIADGSAVRASAYTADDFIL